MPLIDGRAGETPPASSCDSNQGNGYTCRRDCSRRRVPASGREKDMAMALTEPLATYIAAVNGNEVESAVGCFDEDASVLDEGRTIRGRSGIRRWIVETKKKYRHTIDPLKSAKEDDKVTVTCRLSGDFPGR